MTVNTDPRFRQSRFEGAQKPRRYSAEGRGGDTATRRSYFAESARKNQYQHADRIRIEKSKFAREE
jgi:hypothetical protein